MNISMIGKNPIKHYLKKKIFTDAIYTHTKRVCKDFKIKNLGEYHELYFQSDTLLFKAIHYC